MYKCLVLLSFLGLTYVAHAYKSYLDLKELDIKYDVTINGNPTVINESNISRDLNQLVLLNNIGKKFLCLISPDFFNINEDKKQSNVHLMHNVKQLLEPLRNKCLIMTKDWWSYEFCYGKSIRQYHTERGKLSGPVVILGNYDTSNASDGLTSINSISNLRQKYDTTTSGSKNPDKMFYSQYDYYTNGSMCEATGYGRKSTIRFTCSPNAAEDIISRVDEFETCHYLLTITTNRLCSIPIFRGLEPQKISCSPLITKHELDERIQTELKKNSSAPIVLNDEEVVTVKDAEKKHESDGALTGTRKALGTFKKETVLLLNEMEKIMGRQSKKDDDPILFRRAEEHLEKAEEILESSLNSIFSEILKDKKISDQDKESFKRGLKNYHFSNTKNITEED